ncbi:MAG TPA: hypothetical protein V6D47_02325 [Oscillatoriaceae cyanobacterium]
MIDPIRRPPDASWNSPRDRRAPEPTPRKKREGLPVARLALNLTMLEPPTPSLSTLVEAAERTAAHRTAVYDANGASQEPEAGTRWDAWA